jgi:acyl carrier protein
LFAQESVTVNPENIRNVNELVNSVVENEFTSEAKKIFSAPKVIRTVADLVDFILERLREIIANNQLQQQSPSIGDTGIS